MNTAVQLFGERHSGTNWLQNLIEKNFRAEIQWKYGFKHWLPDESLAGDNETAFIAMFRNPLDWIRAMHRKPYHAPFHVDNSMQEFLTREWTSYYGSEWKSENRFEIATEENLIERFRDVFELRAVKNRSFLRVGEQVQRFVWIRYEDLCSDPGATLDRLAHQLGLTRRRRLWGYKFKSRPAKVYPDFDLACEELILKQLDWEGELELGYESYRSKLQSKCELTV